MWRIKHLDDLNKKLGFFFFLKRNVERTLTCGMFSRDTLILFVELLPGSVWRTKIEFFLKFHIKNWTIQRWNKYNSITDNAKPYYKQIKCKMIPGILTTFVQPWKQVMIYLECTCNLVPAHQPRFSKLIHNT